MKGDQILRMGESCATNLAGFLRKLNFTRKCTGGPRRRLKSLIKFGQLRKKYLSKNKQTKKHIGLPIMAQQKRIWLVSKRMQVQSLVSLSGLRPGVAMSCGVGHRCGSDLPLLWLWCRPAAAALILPLVWEPPYAMGAAQKRQNV